MAEFWSDGHIPGISGGNMDVSALTSDDILGMLAESLSSDRPFDDVGGNPLEFLNRFKLRTPEGDRFDWATHEYQKQPFRDTHPELIFQTGAQLGKSVILMANMGWRALDKWGSGSGYYFPDYFLPTTFSEQRFKPFIKSSSELSSIFGKSEKGDKADDSKRIRTLGASVIFFLSVKGTTSTEGLPLSHLYFDEVRRMAMGDIERTKERLSHQINPVVIMASTARYPDADINYYFLDSCQFYYHSKCNCKDGVILTDVFPNCIGKLESVSPKIKDIVSNEYARYGIDIFGMQLNSEDSGASRSNAGNIVLINEETGKEPTRYPEAFYYCPRCGKILPRPGVGGRWIAKCPEKFPHGYHAHQMLSPAFSAGRLLQKYETATDIQELYNSAFGLPFIDRNSQIVLPEHLEACENTDISWKDRGQNCAMGIDGMGGYNCVVIKEKTESGKFRTVWLGVIIGDDPWTLCNELMRRFDVSVGVVDSKPNWNDAMRFAKRFPRRVWLANYVKSENADMIRWSDKNRKTHSEKKTEREVIFKHTVCLERTKMIEWSLNLWRARMCETPSRRGPIQKLPKLRGRVLFVPGMKTGIFEPTMLCQEVYWDHLQRLVKKIEWVGGEERGRREGQFRIVFEHVGLDPHFAHADVYANAALQRVPTHKRRIFYVG